MVSEAPLSDDTIFRILLVGLDADLPLTPADAIELVELLVKRAAAAYTEGYETLTVNRLDIVEILLHCSRYKVPETIKFAENYLPPLLALSVQYSKVISILLILSAHNPTTIGANLSRS